MAGSPLFTCNFSEARRACGVIIVRTPSIPHVFQRAGGTLAQLQSVQLKEQKATQVIYSVWEVRIENCSESPNGYYLPLNSLNHGVLTIRLVQIILK